MQGDFLSLALENNRVVLKFYLGGVSFARLESNKTYANNTWFRIQAERDGSEGTNRFRCIEIKQHISWFLALLSIKMIIMLTLMFFRRGVHMYILHEDWHFQVF